MRNSERTYGAAAVPVFALAISILELLDERITAYGGYMLRAIVGFHKDDENHWVADLECGHTQHVRHDPPWQERPWVQTEQGRAQSIGRELNCVKCEEELSASGKS